MDVVSSEKLLSDVKTEFKHYITYQQKSQSHFSAERGIEETPVLHRKNYAGKQKRPLSEVSDRQQRRHLSDFVVSTTSRAVKRMSLQLNYMHLGSNTRTWKIKK